MKSPSVWLLLVLLLLVCGMIRGAEKPQPDAKAATEKAVAAQKECSQRLRLPVEITNSIGMKLRLIPAGEFMMGSPDSDSDAGSNEKPQHKVRITKPFYLGVYEVTQAEYERVMETNPSWFSPRGMAKEKVAGLDTGRFPVEYVSWEDATKFCKKLSAKEGKTYRLPTEAEWEYACRAGTTTRYSFGDDEESLGEYAWYRDGSDNRTHPVGEKKPNAWGLHDMHGNVWEWCADCYGRDYYAVSPTDDPVGPETAAYRVLRGGCWVFNARYCRAAYRRRFEPRLRYTSLGFRVAVVPSGR
jgi:formylglycine-generating enzyme required for sulfatase activity